MKHQNSANRKQGDQTGRNSECDQEPKRFSTYKVKTIQVVLRDEAKLQWDELHIPNLESLFNAIRQKLENLKTDPEHGTHIPNDRVPKAYIREYEVNNLWKVNLPKAWRIIYTLRGNSYEITVFVIDILSHKEYEKKFGYKT